MLSNTNYKYLFIKVQMSDCPVSGKPKPDVEWFKEGRPIKAGEDVQIYEEDGIHCLWIKKANLRDSGSYSCTAANPKGQSSTSWLLTVRSKQVLVSPSAPWKLWLGFF